MDNIQNFKKDILLVSVILIVLLLIGYIVTPNNIVYHGINPHPFLILSIIISINYGYRASLAISFFLGLMYLGILHFQVDYLKVESLISVEFLTLPLTMVFLNPIIGEMCERLRRKTYTYQKDLNDKNSISTMQKNEIKSLNLENEELKKRLVSKLDTVRALYENSVKFDSVDKNEIINNLAEILIKEIKISSLKVLKYERGDFYEVLSYESGEYTSSDTKINVSSDSLIQRAVDVKGAVYLGNTIKEISGDSCVYANPILVSNEARYVLVIYKIPFLNFIPSNIKLMQLYVEWAATSLERSLSYSELVKDTIIDKNYNTFRKSYFEKRLDEEFEKSKLYMIPLTTGQIKVELDETIGKVRAGVIYKAFNEIVSSNLDKTDLLAHDHSDKRWYILLPIKSIEDGQRLESKIKEDSSVLFEDDKTIKDVSFSFKSFSPEMEHFRDLI